MLVLRMADTLAHRQEGRLRDVYVNKRKETGDEIGRQTGRQTGTLTDGQEGRLLVLRMADMLAHRQRGRLTGAYVNKQKETGRQAGTQTGRQTASAENGRHAGTQTGRQTDRCLYKQAKRDRC